MQLAELPVYFKTHARIAVPFLPWWYTWIRGQLEGTGVTVPCDGCGAQCCQRNTIEMVPGLDDPTHYRTELRGDVLVLERRPDGACVHLGADDRCTVYDRRPFMCRTYDCRAYSAARTVVLDEEEPDALTLSCAAGLTRFEVIPKNAEGERAMRAVQALRENATREGMAADTALAFALMTWPDVLRGPAWHFLNELRRRAPEALRAAVHLHATRTR